MDALRRETYARIFEAIAAGISEDEARPWIEKGIGARVPEAFWREDWEAAAEKLATDPPVRSAADAAVYLAGVRAAVEAHPWDAHPPTHRAVLDRVISEAERLGWIRLDLATRTIGAQLEVPHATVATALGRLAEEGWLSWDRSRGTWTKSKGRRVRKAGTIKLYRSRLFDGCLYAADSPPTHRHEDSPTHCSTHVPDTRTSYLEPPSEVLGTTESVSAEPFRPGWASGSEAGEGIGGVSAAPPDGGAVVLRGNFGESDPVAEASTPRCPACGDPMTLRPGGTTASGRTWEPYYVCPVRDAAHYLGYRGRGVGITARSR